MTTPRSSRREGFSEENRLRLLEGDVDDIVVAVDRLDSTLDGIRKTLMGLLGGVATACVMLAVNLLVGG